MTGVVKYKFFDRLIFVVVYKLCKLLFGLEPFYIS